jgi:hypothetical protein
MSNKISAMPNKVTIDQFSDELGKDHGVIDVNNMSTELKSEMENAGISQEELKRIAGPDGQIKTYKKADGEFRKLFKAVDRFETKKSPKDFRLQNMARIDEPFTSSGRLYEALKNEVQRNRQLPIYQKPGTFRAEDMKTLTEKDADQYLKSERTLKPIHLKMEGIDQMKLSEDHEKNNKSCFPAAERQAVDYNKKTFKDKAPHLNGYSQAIQIAYAEDKSGKVVVDPNQFEAGKNYIDKCLQKGYPVLVGLSHGNEKSGNRDGNITDHFVTINGRGYDEDGRLYYSFALANALDLPSDLCDQDPDRKLVSSLEPRSKICRLSGRSHRDSQVMQYHLDEVEGQLCILQRPAQIYFV